MGEVADAGFAVAATADGGLLTVKGCFLKFPGAAARALGHDQEQRSDEHTVAVSAVSGSRRPAVAHLSAGSAPSDSGTFKLV